MNAKRFLGGIILTILASPFLSAALVKPVHEFAQIGAGGGFQSVLLVFNPADEETSIHLELLDDAGEGLVLDVDGESSSSMAAQIPPKGTKTIVISSASATPKAGWARLTASRSVGAQVLFEIRSGEELHTQAAVESTGRVLKAELFVDGATGNTGVAIVNPSESTWVRLFLTLRDQEGNVVETTALGLPPRGHLAQFLPQLLGKAEGVRGSLQIFSTGQITVLTLQQTGLVLGTLPVMFPVS